MSPLVRPLVGRSAGRSVFHNFLKGAEDSTSMRLSGHLFYYFCLSLYKVQEYMKLVDKCLCYFQLFSIIIITLISHNMQLSYE